MKLSISMPEADLAILDQYAARMGLPSRSAALQQAIRLLGQTDLEDDYAQAWDEWESSGEQALWDRSVGDGVTDAPR